MKEKIFDIHTHIYPENIAERAAVNLGNFYNFHVEGKGTYSDLERQGGEAGVCGFLLLGVATNAHQTAHVNEFIAETVRQSCERGYRTLGFMGMHQDCPDFAEELDRGRRLGLRGVKIHPDIQGVNIDDPRLYELYSLVEGEMPVYFHMGDDRPQYRYSAPERLVRVLKDFPRLVVGAAHFGGYKAWDEAVPLLRGRERVWFDTSSALWAMSASSAREIVSQLGCERLMFGTDYPVTETAEEIRLFDRLGLGDKEREDVLWNNAQRFLDLDGTGDTV